MGMKCLTETCYLSAEFLPDSFRTGLDAVRVLEEQMLSGIEPDNTSTAQADFELFVRNLRDLLLVRARARALLNRSGSVKTHAWSQGRRRSAQVSLETASRKLSVNDSNWPPAADQRPFGMKHVRQLVGARQYVAKMEKTRASQHGRPVEPPSLNRLKARRSRARRDLHRESAARSLIA